MSFSHFFLLGAPKAGTTALYHYINQHPDVVLSRPKEPHFFDVRYSVGLEQYKKRFFPQSAPVMGEATPHYLFVPYVAERIAESLPEARLLAVLRDPVERAYSDWWMYWTRGTEELTFEAAIRSNLQRLEDGPSFYGPEAEKMWRRYYHQTASGEEGTIVHRPYLEIGHYAEQLKRYLQYFDRSQIEVFLFRDFRRDAHAIVREAWRTLGLSESVPLSDSEVRQNAAMGGIIRPVYRTVRALGVESVLHKLPRRVRTLLKQSTAKLTPRPDMSSAVRTSLRDYYAPHVRQLEALIERDLRTWRARHY